MHHGPRHGRRASALRAFLANEASGGLVLIGVTVVALAAANSPLSGAYFGLLDAKVLGLSVLHWINDALMALFFLLVGLEIKREVLDGQLSTWPRRVLPGIAALGGMVVPALVYLGVTRADPGLRGGWAIPAATDIAFALGVLALLGPRVPASLKVFLTALAILDDLGAIVIIALFYTEGLSLPMLGAAALCILALLAPQPLRGQAPLALSRPRRPPVGLRAPVGDPRDPRRRRAGADHPALRRSAGAPFRGIAAAPARARAFIPGSPSRSSRSSASPMRACPSRRLSADAALGALPLGIALGLFLGKLVGVYGFSILVIRLGLADLPAGASRLHFFGVALLCGIGFTMSLFIGALAFPDRPDLTDATKIGVLAGSVLSALAGWLVLRLAPPERAFSPARPSACS